MVYLIRLIDNKFYVCIRVHDALLMHPTRAKDEERCKTCESEYPEYDRCSEIKHICDDNDKAFYAAQKYFEQGTGGLDQLIAGLNEPGRPNSSCKQPGRHIELDIRLPDEIFEVIGERFNHPGSLVSCKCCRMANGRPKIDEQWGVTVKLETFKVKDITGKTYTLFNKHSGSHLLNDAELPSCTGW